MVCGGLLRESGNPEGSPSAGRVLFVQMRSPEGRAFDC